MKKLTALFLSLLLIAGILPVAGAADGGSIAAAAVSAKPGETVDIPVTVSGNPGFCYLKLAFSYDDTALTFVKAENGAVSTDAFTPTAAALTWDSDNDATANGTLCTLTFTVKENAKEGAYDIGLRLVQCFNYNEAPVAFTVTGGKITVEKTHEHTWDNGTVTTVPTCKDTGVKTFTCTVCGATRTESVDKNAGNHVGDTEIRNGKGATCGENGYTGDTYCKGCGVKLSSGTVIEATGNHTYGEWIITTPATGTAAGEKTRECSVCGKKETETIPPTGSATEAKISAATISAKPGDTVQIPVTVSGNPGFSYLKLAFSYDDTALAFVKAENGAVSTDAFTPTAAALTWDSDNDATANGTLCTLTFTVKSNAKAGTYDVGLKLIQCFNYDEAPVAFAVTGGKLTVTPVADDFLPGDVDHDGSVTAADARLALRRAVDLEDFASGSYEFRAADIDRSGAVTAADARIILRIAVQLESAEDYR